MALLAVLRQVFRLTLEAMRAPALRGSATAAHSKREMNDPGCLAHLSGLAILSAVTCLIAMQAQTINLTKSYPGHVTAVQPMNLQLSDGIVGLLGPNGAGKTTLMRMLATLLEPSAGTALIDGHDIRYDKPAVRALLGYLPQDFGLYPSLSITECLDYMGLLAGLGNAKDRRARIDTMLERVNLTEFRHRKVGALSGGMKRRLGIAQAILHEPRLVIFDEPTAGLDPEERIRVRNLLSELGGDRIVILSTHIVADIASSAQTIAVMNRGSIVFHGKPLAMIERARGKTWQVFTNDAGLETLRQHYAVIEVQREASGVLARLVGAEVDVPGLEPRDPTLEDAYVWIMSDHSVGPQQLEVLAQPSVTPAQELS